MKVRLLQTVCRPSGTFYPGQVIEDNGELLNGGYAELIEDEFVKEVEVEEVEEPEKPVINKKKRR